MTVAAISYDTFSSFPFSTSRGSSAAAVYVANFKSVIANQRRNTGQAQLVEQRTLDKISDVENIYSISNWGGEDEEPISALSLIDARDFLESLPANFRSPDVVPEPSGTVAFEWRYGRYRSLIVSFRGGGSIAFSVIQSPNRTNFGNEQFHQGQIPAIVSRTLNLLTR